MSDDDPRRSVYAGALGHDSAHVRRRIKQIKQWALLHANSFVDEMLTANPRLEWAMPEAGRTAAPEDYELAFNLTRAEAEIAVAFARGERLADIAITRGSSINTVRTHFAHIKDKLGVSTQTEVLRELMKV
ncbi:response regulator receiver protein [Parvibaculum lavamentivorans DS-1]|uniref:Response regulator receiver protein n=1 Tax=Parvibaculum lavamentivorans (strain DS-1 / DSM 13023 / NCIMB 13966) TaxID=402881 RepID=A7HUP6_PARL1|nr:LuxR C-terminal-related transcriptional regulator [Parvibaculum lavamentivorans]ABS63629.1 response regulator receiver protein [Parvibaculum lavamentivorans DS-1]